MRPVAVAGSPDADLGEQRRRQRGSEDQRTGDTVGGPQLAQAWDLLAPDGALQSVGWASAQPAVLRPHATTSPAKTLNSYVTTGAVRQR